MSAAGRSKRGGGKTDFFPTPTWCVRRLLEAWQPKRGVWFEPGGGHGNIIRTVDEYLGGGDWLTVDIREEARPFLEPLVGVDNLRIVDFDKGEIDDEFLQRLADVTAVIGNPPFYLAEAFIARICAVCPDADIALLLRSGFVETVERSEFLRTCCPDNLALPQRPSFDGAGNDMASYSWFVWPADDPIRTRGHFQVLNNTPLEERKRG